MAIDTAGRLGWQLLAMIATCGGSVSVDQLDFQTRSADPTRIAAEVDRLVASGLVSKSKSGAVALSALTAQILPTFSVSMADQNALTSEALAVICKSLRLRTPSRKQERIDAITAAFIDPVACARIRSELSAAARTLLERIIKVAGPGSIDPGAAGLQRHDLIHASPNQFAYQRGRQPSSGALYELTSRGIVGVTEWDATVWVWREAWPLIGLPYFDDWPNSPNPEMKRVLPSASAVPAVVGVFARALRHWHASPPAVLKNGEPRLGKTDARATAKALAVGESTIDLLARFAISVGFVLPNTVAEAGRGRARTVEQAWLADRQLVEHWNSMSASSRWLKVFGDWCHPTGQCGQQLLVNRHLVLWELSCVPSGFGYDSATVFGEWLSDRYWSVAHPAAIAECIADLRALGAVPTDGPLALTAIAAAALDDVNSVQQFDSSEATAAIVQADLTVISPPDFRPDLALRLASIAEVESDAGATISRLSANRITEAIRGGDTADSIIDFLRTISSVALGDGIVRLVRDAAGDVGRVKVISAPTVVVVTDPADLVAACSVKAAQLTKVSDTVAVSDLPYAKVRAALERKRLAPEIVLGGGSRVVRSSVTDAEQHAERARALRSQRSGPSSAWAERLASEYEREAASKGDLAARLSTVGPLALTPSLIDRLG